MKNNKTQKALKQLEEIALRLLIRKRILKEVEEILPTQSDADNIQIMSGDIKKIRSILATLYKDAIDAQKENQSPSPYMDAYMKVILAMLPITSALGDTRILAGALKQGKLQLGNNSEFKLGSSLTAPKKTPPPPPPLPPKVNIPKKLPPVPPTVKKPGSIPPPPPPPPRK